MQLVLKSNRIIAHGENFLSMGDFVINTETGRTYENATIAECNGCPSDIDSVGYEYHAGEFVPCAPYGTSTSGNVAVLCSRDCKSIKDSLVPFGRMGQVVETTYKGVGGPNLQLTFTAQPMIVFLIAKNKENNNNHNLYFSIISDGVAVSFNASGVFNYMSNGTNNGVSNFVSINNNILTIKCSGMSNEWFNNNYYEYRAIALIKGGE